MQIRTNRKLILVIVAVVLAGSSSCDSAAATRAKAAVTQFHSQYNAGQFHEIYGQADEALKDYRNETDFVSMLEAQSHKLGSVNQSNPWRATTEGTKVIVSVEVEFTKGTGTETFVFLISGDKAILNNYSVDSPQL